MLYDIAADSQKLKWSLAALDIRLICPPIFRRNQKVRTMTKNEREHYQDRWKVERTFSWLK
ncbi:MAG: transposase, partial [Planctomycetaceae bacterium]|nr:transposase [Planctomycetaceae bacterium]